MARGEAHQMITRSSTVEDVISRLPSSIGSRRVFLSLRGLFLWGPELLWDDVDSGDTLLVVFGD